MGLNIRLHNINLKNNFKLSYRIGNTSGDINTINTGYSPYTGATISGYTDGATISGNTVYPSSDVRNYTTFPIIFTGATFNTQYWFKFLDTVTGLYTIENINTHESKYYECYDKIDFYVTVTGDICDTPLSGDVFNPTITLYDYLNDNGYYGNHSSMTGSTGSVYNIYTGNTSNINGETTGLIKSGAMTSQSGTTARIIYSFNYTVDYPPTLPMQPLYVFVEHMDGSVYNGNNLNPKKQGGFEVKRVRMENIFDYISPNQTQTPLPSSTPIPTNTPTPTPTPTSTSTPTPTPTSTPIPPTPTSTPITPTSTPITPTSTPITPTSTPITPTPTPTSNDTPIVNDILMYSGTSVSAACGNIVDLNYYYVGNFGTGTVLHTDSGLIDKAPGTVGAPRYYRYGTDVYSINDSEGTLNAPVGCPTPTPTPIPSYTFNLYVSETSDAVACAGGDTESGLYHQFVITGNTTNFCTSTSFTCDFITSNDFYQFWVSDGTNSRSLTRTGGQGSETASPDGACASCTGTSTATPTPTPTSTSTPTPTPSPTSLPEGISSFGFTDNLQEPCGFGYGPNDYQYYRTYYVNFTSPRSMGGYVVVYLSDSSTTSIPFNQNDTLASKEVFCGCGSPCADMIGVSNIIYVTPTSTPIPEPTATPQIECWSAQGSGTIYNNQTDCENSEGGICNQVVCP